MKGRVAKCLNSEQPSADIQNTMFIIQFFTLIHMMWSAITSCEINSILIESCLQPSFSESIYIDWPGMYANHLLNNNCQHTWKTAMQLSHLWFTTELTVSATYNKRIWFVVEYTIGSGQSVCTP